RTAECLSAHKTTSSRRSWSSEWALSPAAPLKTRTKKEFLLRSSWYLLCCLSFSSHQHVYAYIPHANNDEEVFFRQTHSGREKLRRSRCHHAGDLSESGPTCHIAKFQPFSRQNK